MNNTEASVFGKQGVTMPKNTLSSIQKAMVFLTLTLLSHWDTGLDEQNPQN